MDQIKIIFGLLVLALLSSCEKEQSLTVSETRANPPVGEVNNTELTFRDGGECDEYIQFRDEFCVYKTPETPTDPTVLVLTPPPNNPELFVNRKVELLADGNIVYATPLRNLENDIDFLLEIDGREYILTKSSDAVISSKAEEGDIPEYLNALFSAKDELLASELSAYEISSALNGSASVTTGQGITTIDITSPELLPGTGNDEMLLVWGCDWEKAVTINKYLSRIGWPNDDLTLYPFFVETAMDDCGWKCRECIDPMCVFEGLTNLLIVEEDIAQARLAMLRYALQLSSESETILSADNFLIEDMFRLTLERGICFFIDEDCGQIVTEDALNAVEYFSNFGSDDPYLLYGGEECIENLPYYELWLILGTFYPPQQIIDQIENIWDDNMIISLFNATSSGAATNLDFHSVKICNLPVQIEPVDLFQLIKSEFYVDPFDSSCGTDFELYEEFSDEDWIDNPEGTMFEIEILPIVESGDVVCSFYDDIDDVNTEYLGYRWIFSTVYGRESGWHPVSGNRQFGLYPDGNGCWIFHTAGVDRQTNWYHVLFGGETAFQNADALWDCIIGKVETYATQLGGTTSDIVNLYCRPDIDELIDTWRSYCYNPPNFEMYPPCTECQ